MATSEVAKRSDPLPKPEQMYSAILHYIAFGVISLEERGLPKQSLKTNDLVTKHEFQSMKMFKLNFQLYCPFIIWLQITQTTPKHTTDKQMISSDSDPSFQLNCEESYKSF